MPGLQPAPDQLNGRPRRAGLASPAHERSARAAEAVEPRAGLGLVHHDCAVVTAEGALLDSRLPDGVPAEDSPVALAEDSRVALAEDCRVALVLPLLAAADRAGSCPDASCT